LHLTLKYVERLQNRFNLYPVAHSAAERHVGAVADCFAENASKLISSVVLFPNLL